MPKLSTPTLDTANVKVALLHYKSLAAKGLERCVFPLVTVLLSNVEKVSISSKANRQIIKRGSLSHKF